MTQHLLPFPANSDSDARPDGVLVTSSLRGRASGYTLSVTTDVADVRAAQRLRYQVFADEMGARLRTTASGLDADEFDDYCDHMVVRDDASGATVGTYRMLPPERAEALDCRYSDGEFDTAALRPIYPSLVETGRSCVHPDHRNGAVIGLMWAGIARYMQLSGHRYLGGCASVPLTDGGAQAAAVWQTVQSRYLAPAEFRVTPLRPWDGGALATAPISRRTMPPLLRGYLRLGAWIAGPPAYDPDFGVADFYVLLCMDRVDARYLRHFLGAAA